MARFNYPLQNATKLQESGAEGVMMLAYSALLTLTLALSSPWLLLRMATTQRYREGLLQRLGAVPAYLLAAIQGKRVLWVHAVSVGEVLAASRLVGEMEAALGEEFRVVISTTTRTGQALARERFGAERVFYMPLDLAFAVRAYLRAIRPVALILMENELWPRMLYECAHMSVPVAVVNARMSDRSFARAMRMQFLWGGVMRQPALWLAQSEEDALRLVAVGVRTESVQVPGNMKYDTLAPRQSRIADKIREVAAGRLILVAGSTVAGTPVEEKLVLEAWKHRLKSDVKALLVLAPRHPERFALVESLLQTCRYAKASAWGSMSEDDENVQEPVDVVLLDTIGDLAAVYGVADAAFVGGSLVERGGHNPLEPARFGVAVVMGPSFQNFRDIVAKMREAGGVLIVQNKDELETVLFDLLTNREYAKAIGEHGRQVFEQQQGATARTVKALVGMICGARP